MNTIGNCMLMHSARWRSFYYIVSHKNGVKLTRNLGWLGYQSAFFLIHLFSITSWRKNPIRARTSRVAVEAITLLAPIDNSMQVVCAQRLSAHQLCVRQLICLILNLCSQYFWAFHEISRENMWRECKHGTKWQYRQG